MYIYSYIHYMLYDNIDKYNIYNISYINPKQKLILLVLSMYNNYLYYRFKY